MNILVAIKRVIDYQVRVQIQADQSGVVTDGVKMSMNPFDEIAVEEALRMQEVGQAEQVIVCAIGPMEAQQTLRTALAMGADRAIHINSDADLQPLQVAHTLHGLVKKEQPGLVLMGKQAIDGDNNQTGQMLAALWQRPQATFASNIEFKGKQLRVTREVDAGLEVIDVDLPAVITTDLRLNEPRYVKMPDIMKAKRKPLEQLALSDFDLPEVPTLAIQSVEPPAARTAGKKVDDVPALVEELKQRGVWS